MKKLTSLLLIFVMTLMILQTYSAYAKNSGDVSGIQVNLINIDPNPALAGNIADAKLAIWNIQAGPAENFTVEFIPSYPFTLVPGEDAMQSLGTINSYQGNYNSKYSYAINYKVMVDKDAPVGTYELKVRYNYDGIKSPTEQGVMVDVKARENAEIIHIDKTVLIPGNQSTMKFTINNVGNAPLKDLTFSWSNADKVILPVGSDNTRYISYLGIGQSTEIEYDVMADTTATPGLYKLDLNLTYHNSLANSSNAVNTISTIAGVYVGGTTDFDVAFSDNTNGQTSFSVANIGSNPAYSVSVMIPEQRTWSVTGSNSVIIGNLNKGDYTIASFKMQSAFSANTTRTGRNMNFADNPDFAGNFTPQMRNASSPNMILVQVAYTDTMGGRNVVEKEVNLGMQSMNSTSAGFARGAATTQQSFFVTYEWYIVALVIIAAAYIFYKKYIEKKILDGSLKMPELKTKRK